MTNDSDSDDVKRKKWNYRVRHWEDIVTQQFQLAYFGRVSYGDSQMMAISEREFIFNKLIEQKKSEQEAIEKSAKEAKKASNKYKSKRNNHRRRR